MFLPIHTISQDVDIDLKGGRLAGVRDLNIHHGSNLIISPEAKINSYNSSCVELDSLTVYGAGHVSFLGVTENDHVLRVRTKDEFVIKGGGVVETNNLQVQSKSINKVMRYNSCLLYAVVLVFLTISFLSYTSTLVNILKPRRNHFLYSKSRYTLANFPAGTATNNSWH